LGFNRHLVNKVIDLGVKAIGCSKANQLLQISLERR